MYAKKLVVEHPLSLNFVVRVMTLDLSFQLPGAGHMIDQVVAPLCRGLCTRTSRHQRD
jgi:hypothetical protein